MLNVRGLNGRIIHDLDDDDDAEGLVDPLAVDGPGAVESASDVSSDARGWKT